MPNSTTVVAEAHRSPASLANFGTNTDLTVSPFVDLASQTPLFQTPGSPCLDQGIVPPGIDYSALSVVTPFSADVGLVDVGDRQVLEERIHARS